MKCPYKFTTYELLRESCQECTIVDCDLKGEKSQKLDISTPKSGYWLEVYDKLDVHKLVELFKTFKANVLEDIIIIGDWLLYMKQTKRWKEYGSHLESFEDFKKELNEDRTTLGYYMQIAKIRHLLKGVEIGYGHLIKTIPLLRGKPDDESRKILERMVGHTPDNFTQALREAKGLDPCHHEETELWGKCKKCNKFLGRVE